MMKIVTITITTTTTVITTTITTTIIIIIKITISLTVIGLENTYFPLSHLPSIGQFVMFINFIGLISNM